MRMKKVKLQIISNMITKFVVYGIMGWCMEILWTGFNSLLQKDTRLLCNTSLWMFFIYGMAAFLEPLYGLIMAYPVVVRGGIYVFCIFATEYLAGSVMKKFDACPWDYSGAKYSVQGVIRLDYAPLWFAAGLLFEFVHLNFAF